MVMRRPPAQSPNEEVSVSTSRSTAQAGDSRASLQERYVPGATHVVLTGVQAIVRMMVENHAAERRAGRSVGTFVSGYQGSPLGGLDMVMSRVRGLEDDHGIHLQPGINEELAATAVWGSQTPLPGGLDRDGVLGVWYGKAPGVDRAADALRHANLVGVHPDGGVVLLAGDDPGAKSSTIPCASDATLASLMIPVLFPRDADDIVRLGRIAATMSRASGCWVALKITADVADGIFTLEKAEPPEISWPEVVWDGRPWTYHQAAAAAPPHTLQAEEQLMGPRWAAVRQFALANGVNQVHPARGDAWLGVVSGGKTSRDLQQALTDAGIDDPAGHGIRVLDLGMTFPLIPEQVCEFAGGLEQVLVVEEKQATIEAQLKEILYGQPDAPVVLGRRDAAGSPLVPGHGELTAGRLTGVVRRVVGSRVSLPRPASPRLLPITALAPRTAYFCSGCPHNRSTVVPEGSLAAGGIGCHAMVAGMDRPESRITGLTQMGGEGAQWIGQAPFSPHRHVFQNLGDGTYFHSGQLAVQACVAAGVNITFKILYNRTVAMTGGQDPEGGIEVLDLTRQLTAAGVGSVIVCTDDTTKYPRRTPWPKEVTVWGRDRLDEAQRRLRDEPGVTVIVYDQWCAAEARRLRKRGSLPTPTTRVVINEAVCEGCGDCGAKSNCLSVEPVDTELGRRTRIDQTSCNTDYSCLDGDCPSFVTVDAPPAAGAGTVSPTAPPSLPDPVLDDIGDTYNILLAGIGGTGILTVNQILATAAADAGLTVHGVDQTGLSQKAGPVTSHLRLSPAATAPANRIGPGQADCLLAFDAMAAADPRTQTFLSPDRTRTALSTARVPTGRAVRDVDAAATDWDAVRGELARRTVAGGLWEIDALALARRLFGSTTSANLVLLGAAFQRGWIPVPADSIEHAVRLNGVAIDDNIAAFRWGRAAVVDPQAVPGAAPPLHGARALRRTTIATRLAAEVPDLDGPALGLATSRAAHLLGYQGPEVARRYLALVGTVRRAEKAVGPDHELSLAVAEQLYRLTAYKDEYEVARLLVDPTFDQHVQEQVPGAARMRYRLHPPLLRALGLKRKVSLGAWSRPVLRSLAAMRVLRGTPFDVFGWSHMRRTERKLLARYRHDVTHLAASLDAGSYPTAVQRARAPELIKGYESVKLASIQRYHDRLATISAADLMTKD